jgi:hypothetical protein
MTLPTALVEQFYEIWRPLLNFANEHLRVVPTLSNQGLEDSIDVNHAVKVRDALWKNEAVIDQFIEVNPAHLSTEALSIVQSWKYRRQGTFFVYKALKKHTIFISQDKKTDVYAVKGLYSSYEEMFGPYLPTMIEAVLLPFYDEIITDGLFQGYNLTFGPGIKRNLKEIYDYAKELGEIVYTLLPTEELLSRESLIAKAEVTNEKVLNAFQKYQYQSGLSPKTVERDVLTVTSLAHFLLTGQPEPSSLRDFPSEALKSFRLSLSEKGRKLASLSLKRYISFLRDTNRLDWDEAENMLEIVKHL